VLFRVDVEAQGHTRKVYCLDEAEKLQILTTLADKGISENEIAVCRFKGLGMATTLTLLMGKGKAASQRAWMEKDGRLVEADL